MIPYNRTRQMILGFRDNQNGHYESDSTFYFKMIF